MRKQKIDDVYDQEMDKLDLTRKKIAEIEGQNFFSLKNQLKREKHENEELKFRLNDSNADIRRKRTKINEMRKQRTLLDGVYSKIESKLRKKANHLLSLIEKTEKLDQEKQEQVKALKNVEEQAKKEASKVNQHIIDVSNKHIDQLKEEKMSQMAESVQIYEMIQTKKKTDKVLLTHEEAELIVRKQKAAQAMSQLNNNDGEQSIDWVEENRDAKNNGEPDSVEVQERQLESLKRQLNKLKLITEMDDVDQIMRYYKDGGNLNEKLYHENLELQMTIEEYQLQREQLERELKDLRRRNNEFEKVRKDDVLEKYLLLKSDKTKELLQIEHSYHSSKGECDSLDAFLVQAMKQVMASARAIQDEYKDIDELDKQRHELLKEKKHIESEMVKLQETAEEKEEKERLAKLKLMDPEEVKPEDLLPRHPKKTSEKGFSDGEYASTAHNDDLTDEEMEQHHNKNQKWEDETDEKDHREIRMLNKVKRLETIVENTNLIMNYIENQGSIMLSQLDNFMTDKKDTERKKLSSADKTAEEKKKMGEVMGDIDDLCLNCRQA